MKKIDLTGDDASAVSSNRKLSKVALTSKEQDGTKPSSSSAKDEGVIADIVSNSTKHAVQFKDSADTDNFMECDINTGTKEDMNLDNNDNDKSMNAFEKLAKQNAAINTSKKLPSS